MYTEKEFLSIVHSLSGVKILYQMNGIYLLKVNSFKACKELFDRRSIDWCIARSRDHWNDYIEHPGNHQYFIVDFNVIDDDSYAIKNKAFIGFTITDDNKIYAAHGRDDRNLLETPYGGKECVFDTWLKEKKLYDFVINQHMLPNKQTTDNNVPSMVPVYILVATIILAMMTLFLH